MSVNSIKLARSYILTWFGVIGTVLTILSSLDPIIILSSWCRYIIEEWSYITTTIWSYIFSFVQLDVGPFLAAYLSASLFISSISVASFLERKIYESKNSNVIVKDENDLDEVLLFFICLIYTIIFIPYAKEYLEIKNPFVLTLMSIFGAVALIYFLSFIVKIAYYIKDRRYKNLNSRHFAVTMFLFSLLSGFLLLTLQFLFLFIFVLFFSITIIFCFFISDPKFLRRRIVFAFMALVTIVFLNYIYIYLVEFKRIVVAPI